MTVTATSATTAAQATSSSTASANNTLDYNNFLQLLVAQLKIRTPQTRPIQRRSCHNWPPFRR